MPGLTRPIVFARRGRLAEAVVEHLTMAIVTEVYPAGTSLPTEAVLCEMYKVSRTVIREVSTTLAEKGLIVSQQGRGTIVQDKSHWNLLDSIVLRALFHRDDGISYLDNLIEIRLLLECAMAAKAAARISDDDIERMKSMLGNMEKLRGDPAAYSRADVELHNFIMAVSGNELGRAIINGIQGQALTSREYNGRPTPTDITQTHRAHEAIVAAICRRDSAEAAREMRHHIEISWHHRRTGEKPADAPPA